MCFSSFWKTWNMKTPLCICLLFKVINSLVQERNQPKLLRNTTKYDNHTCFCLIKKKKRLLRVFQKLMSIFDLFVVVMVHNRTAWFSCNYKAQTLHWPDLLLPAKLTVSFTSTHYNVFQRSHYSFLKNTDVWLNPSFVQWPGFCFAIMNS